VRSKATVKSAQSTVRSQTERKALNGQFQLVWHNTGVSQTNQWRNTHWTGWTNARGLRGLGGL